MYRVAFEYHNYGYGSSIAIVIFLICIIGAQIIKRFDVKEE
jgi:raffinose/stachyose/melibiose transport system permease protein